MKYVNINERRIFTQNKELKLKCNFINAEEIIANKACVYATGSFGRLEANIHSDLDLFIVGKTKNNDNNKSELSHLDEILLKAELIKAIRIQNIPDFDGDGKYLHHYTVNNFTDNIGRNDDDYSNTMTARLLLFLESKPLIGKDIYHQIINDVVSAYWRDYAFNQENFIPAYLTNDILRLWRTFCVNYESKKKFNAASHKYENKIKNYKLKHSRMITCFSSIIYLIGIYSLHQKVTPVDAFEMTQISPIERIQWLTKQDEFKSLHESAHQLISLYEKFLDRTNCDKETLSRNFQQNNDQWMRESYLFGDKMHEVLTVLGNITPKNRLYRLLIV